jgi:16S rRNA processing protein RimM
MSGPPDADAWIAVGVVRGAFGVQGALKIEPFTDVASSVLNHVRQWRMEPLELRGTSGAAGSTALPFPLPAQVSVQAVKQHGGFIIATILPSVTREQALALKGTRVLVERADFPAAEPDEYYWSDLIGCAVSDPTGKPLGTVVAVDDHGAQSLLRLDNDILIPFVAAFVLEVVPAEKRIVADWSADWS